jgi:hypothetical protein
MSEDFTEALALAFTDEVERAVYSPADNTLRINPQYWQKLTSEARDAILRREFAYDKARAVFRRKADAWLRKLRESATGDERRALDSFFGKE